MAQQITRRKDEREFLVSIGAINTIVALFSLISLYTISKARSGAAVAVHEIMEVFGINELVLLISVALFSTGVSAIFVMKSAPRIIKVMQKIDYLKLTTLVMLLLIVLVYVFTGLIGLFILFLSTSIGLLAPLLRTNRSNLMGVLMIPLMIFYSGIWI